MPAKPVWVALTEYETIQRLQPLLRVTFDRKPLIGFGGYPDGCTKLRDGWWIALEVEKSQTHPEGNVLKYWPWVAGGEQVVLVHVIAPDARKQRGARTDLTRWLANLMETQLAAAFEYHRVQLGSPTETIELRSVRASIRAHGGQSLSRSPAVD